MNRLHRNGNRALGWSAAVFAALMITIAASGCGGGGGGGGAATPPGDTTPPAITLVYPAPGARVSDIDFASSAFYVQFRYADASAPKRGSLLVKLKMDSDPFQTITSYFSFPDDFTVKSAGISTFTSSLFFIASNMTPARAMTVNISISDAADNVGSASSSFFVIPAGGVPPPPGRVSDE